jgi:hypothetical membrane protein
MGLLTALALFAAGLIACAAVIVVWARSPRRWAKVAAVAGVVSLVAGIALYLVGVFVALNYYDERSDPTWLTGILVLAFVLAGGGLVAIVLAALVAARRAPFSP